ncbi:tetratricopeptide repeat protein [Geobacter pelophilus]|uniref:Tetratricopeptide repeat protein n=1 Tax=Geoanaerobacter pelophilus TaxID=60036 RepID=A0AAW4L8V3_9BACT|nr:tetratricopeptide repeat protein [Geoanaerobacter pelophilus]MBT0665468.1 tetratricopeptide repeat protein [Geoanaerobacter pelophilus]
MNREQILVAAVALIAGLLIGYMIFTGKAEKAQQTQSAIPMGSGSPTDYQARIAEAEKLVAKEPGNRQAWVQLGNDYFDTDQAQKAITAYGKALELDPKDPNILTDQGIMYRKMGWFDKAMANFEKANQIDPRHSQSLMNLGVVYASDLKQPDKAIAAWEKFLTIDSTSPTAQQVKGMIEQIKTNPQGMSQGMK